VGDFGPGINLPPSPGSQAATCNCSPTRKAWISALPDSHPGLREAALAVGDARECQAWPQGQGGHSVSISRDGGVPKLVIAEASGAEALDRAAVAGISASVHSPAPRRIQGDRIVLQMNFAYNMPRQ